MTTPILTGRMLRKPSAHRARAYIDSGCRVALTGICTCPPELTDAETDLWGALQREAARTRAMVRDPTCSPRALAMAGARIARITQAMKGRASW